MHECQNEPCLDPEWTMLRFNVNYKITIIRGGFYKALEKDDKVCFIGIISF